MKKSRFALLGALLLVVLFSVTGCSSECMTPLCRNNAQLFSDFCRRCNEVVDGVRDIFRR